MKIEIEHISALCGAFIGIAVFYENYPLMGKCFVLWIISMVVDFTLDDLF